MFVKVFTVLSATLALAQAGILAAAPVAVSYSPANEVSHAYTSFGAVSHQPLIAQGRNFFSINFVSPNFFEISDPSEISAHYNRAIASLSYFNTIIPFIAQIGGPVLAAAARVVAHAPVVSAARKYFCILKSQ